MTQRDRHRYALADYCVERRETGWFFGRQLDRPSAYRGPYRSTASVTLSIARQLRRGIERREGNHHPAIVDPTEMVVQTR